MAPEALLLLALLAPVLTLATLRAAARHEARTEAAFPPEGRILDVGGVQVHAAVMGAGPDLVLIHGSSGNTRDMTFSLAPKLAARYRVIAFDRPGLGYTARLGSGGASIFEQADLLAAAARQLGADRPIVLGHSYGGAVALAWAAYYPEDLSALVAVSSLNTPPACLHSSRSK